MSSAKRNLLDIRKRRSEQKTSPKAREVSAPIAERPLRLKDRRRRQRFIYAGAGVFAVALFVGGLGAVSHLERLALQSVTIFGAQELSTETLIAAVQDGLNYDGFQFFSRRNMFLYPSEGIERSLFEDFPRIKEVHVEREALLSQAVLVTVKEREPHARWCPSLIAAEGAVGTSTPPVYEEGCYFLDATGYIFAPEASLIAPLEPALPYVFRGGLLPGEDPIGQFFLRGRLYDAVSFLKKLQRAGFSPQGLTVKDEKDFSVPLGEGPELYVPFEADSTEVVSRLETALEADGMREKIGTLDYIDLRFGNRVYYK